MSNVSGLSRRPPVARPSGTIRRSDLRVYRPSHPGVLAVTPFEIIVVEGTAIAVYPDDRSVQYASLVELLEDHALDLADLDEVTL